MVGDSIYNGYRSVTINAGSGDDTVYNSGTYVSIYSGEGNDSISGGTGTDTIYSNGTGNLIQYDTDGGKDVIFGFSKDDSIQITDSTISKPAYSKQYQYHVYGQRR